MGRKRKIIQLPKGYLSFSQVALWLSNKDRYKKLYFEGDSSYKLNNSGLTFGSMVADALEHQKETGDLLIDTAIELIPKYDVRDQEIVTAIKTKEGEIPVLGRPDLLDSKTKNFYEVKTGRIKWTQKKAENHLQLKFYAMLIYLYHGVTVDHAKLIWMQTYRDDLGEVRPTGAIEIFHVELSLKDILNTMALVSRVAKEIESAWVVYEPAPQETLEEWLK